MEQVIEVQNTPSRQSIKKYYLEIGNVLDDMEKANKLGDSADEDIGKYLLLMELRIMYRSISYSIGGMDKSMNVMIFQASSRRLGIQLGIIKDTLQILETRGLAHARSFLDSYTFTPDA